MMRLPSIILFCGLGLNLLVHTVKADLEYPTNSDELGHIEKLARLDDDDSKASIDERCQIIQDRLGTELMDLLGQQLELEAEQATTEVRGGEEDPLASIKHLKAVVQRYSDVANLREDRCHELSQMSDLLFLVNFHWNRNYLDGIDLLNYLKYFTVRQFIICKPLWDAKFKDVIEQVDEFTKVYLAKLIDHMMLKSFGSAKRPHSSGHLISIANSPPVAGILSFLTDLGDLKQAKGEAADYKWNEFLASVDVTLEPMCRDACNKAKDVTKPYDLLFDRGLDGSKSINAMVSDDKVPYWEWMVGAKVCCRLIEARDNPNQEKENLLFEAYQELTKLPDSTKEAKSGLFSIFG